jgi:hypothetical protein
MSSDPDIWILAQDQEFQGWFKALDRMKTDSHDPGGYYVNVNSDNQVYPFYDDEILDKCDI